MRTEFEPTAEFRHSEGVELSSLGYLEQADVALEEALQIANATYGSSASMQAAAVHRDIALNSLRHGNTDRANVHLIHSERLYDRMRNLVDEWWRQTELGATRSVRARSATVSGDRSAARLFFRGAHDLLSGGNNRYYLTSNDILAAREAKIAKRHLAAVGWTALAAVGVVKATVFDWSNLKQAAATFAGRLPDTLTSSRAANSLTRTTPIHGRVFNV